MIRSLFLVLVSTACLVFVLYSPALAEFAVCNASSHASVSVAFAATWQDGAGNPHGEDQGWYQVDKGKCTIIITTLDVSGYTIYIYGFVKGDPNKTFWGGDNDYCVDLDASFSYKGDAMSTPCTAGKQIGMRLVTSGGVTPYTYFLRD